MYIRQFLTKNRKTGKEYFTHRLVESCRTDKGPRQRVVLHLGTLDLPKSEWKKLAVALEARLCGQLSLFEEDAAISKTTEKIFQHQEFKKKLTLDQEQRQVPSHILPIDINSVQTTDFRQLGPELVGFHMWNHLRFPAILKECRFDLETQALAAAVVIGRLIAPSSDMEAWRRIRFQTALVDILAARLHEVGKNPVYEIADRLYACKETIEKRLHETELDLFPESSVLLLYDLTNTYFEGVEKKNELAHHGPSKEKRSDCCLVTLALLVNSRGFPVFSQIYSGNQSEPDTLIQVLDRLDADSRGKLPGLRPTIVMDRGIATKGNLTLIREREYPYVVIERRAAEKDFLKEFSLKREDFERISTSDEKAKVYVKGVSSPSGMQVLVFSEKRKEKEQAMDVLKKKRFQEDFQKIQSAIKNGYVKDSQKISRRIGRLLERYPSVAGCHEMELVWHENEVQGVILKAKAEQQKKESLQGCYVIETSHQDLSAKEIWKIYSTITRVEYAFKCLKTDLGIRPIYHQLAKRTEAHLFVSVLAYHLLIGIENSLRDQSDHREWQTIKTILTTHQRSTVIMRDDKGLVHQIRLSGIPEPEQQAIYRKLGIKDRCEKRYKIINPTNVVTKEK